MKSWKSSWKKQLDGLVPELREDVKNYPVNQTDENVSVLSDGSAVKSKKKLVVYLTSFLGVLLIAVVIICSVMLPRNKGFDGLAFTFEINPAITLTTDKNGKVTGVISSNSDADVILSDEDFCAQLKGGDIQNALTLFTDCAARLGYLNMDSESAVRLTACGNDGNLLDSAQDCLESYFTGKGVYAVIITETVGIEEFSARSGISGIKSVEDVTGIIGDKDVLYKNRQAENLSVEELADLYQNEMVTDSVLSEIKNSIKGNLEQLERNAEDIKSICELYLEIYGHKDNPAKLLKDYWNVKKYYGDCFEGEFGELVSRMDMLLENYHKNYGVLISDELQMREISTKILSSSVEKIKELLDNFSSSILQQNLAFVSDILNLIGGDGENIGNLISVPSDFSDYKYKVSKLSLLEFEHREKENEQTYNTVRSEISKEDYEAYKRQLTEKYGSLANCWEFMK